MFKARTERRNETELNLHAEFPTNATHVTTQHTQNTQQIQLKNTHNVLGAFIRSNLFRNRVQVIFYLSLHFVAPFAPRSLFLLFIPLFHYFPFFCAIPLFSFT